MHAQLAAVAEDFEAASRRLQRLQQRLTTEQWTRRPSPERWSALECVQHLNLTAEATLPRVRDGIAEARQQGGAAPATYRRDLWGWLIWRALRRPGSFKTKTGAAFVPHADRPAPDILATFAGLQQQHLECVQACDGLPVQNVRIVSPFNERVRYNLYASLTILAVHQHRHLWQAEEAVRP